jgi:GT2 family glycosyltransferase
VIIGIVIPVLNQFEKAVDAIASVKTQYQYEVKVVTNYRKDQSLSAAWNEGLQWSLDRRHSFTLIINDDILFAPQTIDNMVKTFLDAEKRLKCAMITANNVRGLFDNPLEILSYSTDVRALQENPDFACFMVRPTIASRVGFFDENFYPAYFEDNDYHYRISLAGLNAFNDVSSPFYHYGSQTQNANADIPVVPPFAFELNRTYYIGKWGGAPGEEIFTHPYNDSTLHYFQWNPNNQENNLHVWNPPC